MHHPRRPLGEPREVAAGPSAGEGLERLPAGEHEGDHRAGQVLAEGERARHREQRDQVDSHLAAPQGGGDAERQGGERRGRGGGPEDGRHHGRSGQRGGTSGEEASQGDGDEEAVAQIRRQREAGHRRPLKATGRHRWGQAWLDLHRFPYQPSGACQVCRTWT